MIRNSRLLQGPIKSVLGSAANKVANYHDDLSEQQLHAIAQQLNRPEAQAQAEKEISAEHAQTEHTDKVFHRTSKALEVAGMLPVALNVGQGAINLPKRSGRWIADKFRAEGDKLGPIAKPKGWDQYSFNEIGEATGTKEFFGGAAQKGADALAKPVDWVANKTGLSSWRVSANTANAAKKLGKAQDLLSDLSFHERNALGADLTSRISSASDASHLSGDAVKGLIEGVDKSVLSKEGTKMLEAVEGAVGHHGATKAWGSVENAVKGAPGTMGGTSASHTVMHGAFIGMSAMSMFGDARSLGQNMESLRQMYADMTGQDAKKVSTIKLLTGTVPAPVAEARSHMIKTFGSKQVFDIANIGLNIAMMVSKKFSGATAIGAMVGTSLAGSAVDSFMGESILPIHKAFSEAYRTGKEIPAEFYAAYVYAASAELKSHGDTGQQFAVALGKQYEKEHISPGELLKEVSDGKMLKRIELIAKQADKTQVVNASTSPQEDSKNTQTQDATHVARLEGATPEQQRPVVGKFTQKVNQEPVPAQETAL